MTRQIVLRHTSSAAKRRPLLLASPNSSLSSSLSKTFPSSSSAAKGGRSRGFGEAAGGTAAECAAVCCCCPCAVLDLLVLTVCKLPAGLCRKALKQNRRSRMLKKGLLPQPSRRCGCGCDDTELQLHPAATATESLNSPDKVLESERPDEDAMQLEKEMWERFYGGGFWRSPSQKSNH